MVDERGEGVVTDVQHRARLRQVQIAREWRGVDEQRVDGDVAELADDVRLEVLAGHLVRSVAVQIVVRDERGRVVGAEPTRVVKDRGVEDEQVVDDRHLVAGIGCGPGDEASAEVCRVVDEGVAANQRPGRSGVATSSREALVQFEDVVLDDAEGGIDGLARVGLSEREAAADVGTRVVLDQIARDQRLLHRRHVVDDQATSEPELKVLARVSRLVLADRVAFDVGGDVPAEVEASAEGIGLAFVLARRRVGDVALDQVVRDLGGDRRVVAAAEGIDPAAPELVGRAVGQDVADDLVVGDGGRAVEDEDAAPGDRGRRLCGRELAKQARTSGDAEALQAIGCRRAGPVDHRRAHQVDLARHAVPGRTRDTGAVDRRDGGPVGRDDADAREHPQRFVVGARADEHRAATGVLDRTDRVLNLAEGVEFGSRTGSGAIVVIDPHRRLGDERTGRNRKHYGHRGRHQQNGPWTHERLHPPGDGLCLWAKGGIPCFPWPSSYTNGWNPEQWN